MYISMNTYHRAHNSTKIDKQIGEIYKTFSQLHMILILLIVQLILESGKPLVIYIPIE